MPSKPLPLSPAVAQLLRSRRQALGLTLRRVEELSAVGGNAIPHSTLARIEQGIFDPGVRRFRQLLDLYQLPIQAAGDVLDLEALAGATPIERNPAKLRDKALDAWRRGRIQEALACFLSFRRRVPDGAENRAMRHEAILAFAVASASLGRLHLSRLMLDELLLENPEPKILVPILVQQSVVWRSLGSAVAALAFIESAAKHARRDAPKQQGWVQHQHAQILIEQREFATASECLMRAIRYHRQAKSPHDEALAMLSIVKLRIEEGKPKLALAAARNAERFAVKRRFNRIRLCARVDQARVLAAVGSVEDARKLLRGVLADSMAANDDTLCFFCHYYLWQIELGAGNSDRAAIESQAAGYFLKYVDQNSPEAKALREATMGRSHQERSTRGPVSFRNRARR